MTIKRISIYVLVFILLFTLPIFADSPSDMESDQRSDSDQSGSYQEETVSQLRISPSDTSGLHAILLTLIGDYNPIVKDYTYITTSYNGTQQTNHSIEITPDYSWIMTCALFIVVIYCTFKFLGGLFSK